MPSRTIRFDAQLWVVHLLCTISVAYPRSTVAHAQAGAVSIALDYVAPAQRDCPNRADFEELVASRMGYAPFNDTGDARVIIEIAGSSSSALVGSIRLIDASGVAAGRRDISTPARCADLAESLAMAVSILVDEFRVAEAAAEAEPAPEADPGAEPEPMSEPAIVTPPEISVVPPEIQHEPNGRGEPVRAALGVAFLGDVGIAPDPTIGARIGAGVRYSFLEIALELSLSTQVAAASLGSGDRMNVIGYLANLAVCGHLDPVGACALGGGGALAATVQTVANPRAQTSATGMVGARIFGVIPVGDVIRVRPFVEVWAMLVRTAVIVEDRTVWQAEPIAGRLGLELAFDFR